MYYNNISYECTLIHSWGELDAYWHCWTNYALVFIGKTSLRKTFSCHVKMSTHLYQQWHIICIAGNFLCNIIIFVYFFIARLRNNLCLMPKTEQLNSSILVITMQSISRKYAHKWEAGTSSQSLNLMRKICTSRKYSAICWDCKNLHV